MTPPGGAAAAAQRHVAYPCHTSRTARNAAAGRRNPAGLVGRRHFAPVPRRPVCYH